MTTEYLDKNVFHLIILERNIIEKKGEITLVLELELNPDLPYHTEEALRRNLLNSCCNFTQ